MNPIQSTDDRTGKTHHSKGTDTTTAKVVQKIVGIKVVTHKNLYKEEKLTSLLPCRCWDVYPKLSPGSSR